MNDAMWIVLVADLRHRITKGKEALEALMGEPVGEVSYATIILAQEALTAMDAPEPNTSR